MLKRLCDYSHYVHHLQLPLIHSEYIPLLPLCGNCGFRKSKSSENSTFCSFLYRTRTFSLELMLLCWWCFRRWCRFWNPLRLRLFSMYRFLAPEDIASASLGRNIVIRDRYFFCT